MIPDGEIQRQKINANLLQLIELKLSACEIVCSAVIKDKVAWYTPITIFKVIRDKKVFNTPLIYDFIEPCVIFLCVGKSDIFVEK